MVAFALSFVYSCDVTFLAPTPNYIWQDPKMIWTIGTCCRGGIEVGFVSCFSNNIKLLNVYFLVPHLETYLL